MNISQGAPNLYELASRLIFICVLTLFYLVKLYTSYMEIIRDFLETSPKEFSIYITLFSK